MPGLASKWANDESLVKAALEQDGINASKPDDKWSKPVTSSKNQPLVSKWADAPLDSPDVKSSPTKKSSNRRRLGKGRGDHHKVYEDDTTKNNGTRRASKLYHDPPQLKGNPLAERLSKESKVNNNTSSPSHTSVHSGNRDESDEEPDSSISLSNNPLAARLGMLSVDDKNSTKTRSPKLSRQHKEETTSHRKPEPSSHRTRQSKPRAEATSKNEKDTQDNEEQKRIELEMLSYIENLDSKNMDWTTFD